MLYLSWLPLLLFLAGFEQRIFSYHISAFYGIGRLHIETQEFSVAVVSPGCSLAPDETNVIPQCFGHPFLCILCLLSALWRGHHWGHLANRCRTLSRWLCMCFRFHSLFTPFVSRPRFGVGRNFDEVVSEMVAFFAV